MSNKTQGAAQPPPDAAALRQRAEAQARSIASPALSAHTPEEIQRVVHELRVHQIELKMQNEELRTAQAVIEAARVRYFELYDLAPVGYCTLSEKGLILEANLTAATLLGTARSALVQQPLTRLILKEDQDSYYRLQQQLLATGEAQECDLRLVKRDGAFFWAHLTAITAQADDGAPVARVTFSDISARKVAEQEVEQVSRLYATLSQSNQAMVRAADPAAIFAALTRIAVEVGGFQACVVIQRDPESGVAGVVAYHGLDPETAAAIPLPSDADADAEGLPAATALFTDHPRVCGDCADPALDVRWNTWSAAAGIRTCAHYPIRSQGRVTGVFSLFSNRTAAFPAAVTRLLDEMAMDLSSALDHFSRQQALKESEERYRRIVETTQEGVWSVDAQHRITVSAQSETSYRRAPPVATLVTIEEPVGGRSDGTVGTTGRADVVGNHPAADGKRSEPGRVLCRRGIVGQQPAELETEVRS